MSKRYTSSQFSNICPSSKGSALGFSPHRIQGYDVASGLLTKQTKDVKKYPRMFCACSETIGFMINLEVLFRNPPEQLRRTQ